jgi:hypothetical protein
MRTFSIIGALALAIMAVAEPTRAAGVTMYVRHNVADYAAWRKAYDAFRPTQKQMGVTAQAVYQAMDNPNDVTVTHDFKTEAEARAFGASDKLKTAMKNSGVQGAPQIWITKETPGATGKPEQVRMFIRHQVNDYGTWRKAYDTFRPTQQQMGVTAQAVYQAMDNPNDVTVTHDFKTDGEARAFGSSEKLKTAMQNAGVKGAPQIWITSRAAK